MGKQGVTSVADKETKCTLHPVSGAKQLEIETVTLTEPAYTVSPLHRIYSANRLSTQCGEGTTVLGVVRLDRRATASRA